MLNPTMQREIDEIMGITKPEHTNEDKFAYLLGKVLGISFALGIMGFCVAFTVTLGIKMGIGLAIAILM